MRQYLTFQAMESGKCLERTLPARSAASPYGVGSGDVLLGGSESNHPSKVGRSTPNLPPLPPPPFFWGGRVVGFTLTSV